MVFGLVFLCKMTSAGKFTGEVRLRRGVCRGQGSGWWAWGHCGLRGDRRASSVCRGCLESPHQATSKHHPVRIPGGRFTEDTRSRSMDDLARDSAAEAASTNKRDEGRARTIVPEPCHPQSPMAPSTPPVNVTLTGTLERLPTELRRQILFAISNLEDLRALVLASPVYYQLYLLDRRALLETVLPRTVGSVMEDAYAVHASSKLCGPSGELPDAEAMDFVEDRSWLEPATLDKILELCSEQDLAAMASFYLTVIQPLVLNCAALFLGNLDVSLEAGSLSDMERTRFLRALYRFQLYCQVLGSGARGSARLSSVLFRRQLAMFFSPLAGWEIEEVWCMYALIAAKYEEVFETIQIDGDPDHAQSGEPLRLDDPGG